MLDVGTRVTINTQRLIEKMYEGNLQTLNSRKFVSWVLSNKLNVFEVEFIGLGNIYFLKGVDRPFTEDELIIL